MNKYKTCEINDKNLTTVNIKKLVVMVKKEKVKTKKVIRRVSLIKKHLKLHHPALRRKTSL